MNVDITVIANSRRNDLRVTGRFLICLFISYKLGVKVKKLFSMQIKGINPPNTVILINVNLPSGSEELSETYYSY